MVVGRSFSTSAMEKDNNSLSFGFVVEMRQISIEIRNETPKKLSFLKFCSDFFSKPCSKTFHFKVQGKYLETGPSKETLLESFRSDTVNFNPLETLETFLNFFTVFLCFKEGSEFSLPHSGL